MAVILAYGSPALGHLLPTAALLAELLRRGHDVHLRTMSAGVSTMRSAGVHAEPVDPAIEAIAGNDWEARNALGVLKLSIDVLCRRAVLEVDDFRRAVNAIRPDAVIVDANCWGALSAADAGNIPWLLFSPFTPYLRSRGVPPFGPGMRPLPGIAGDIRDAGVRRIVRHVFDRPMLPHINAIRAELGVSPVTSVDGFIRRAPLVLAVGGEPFEYPHPGWAGLVHHIGACAFEPTPTATPEWIDAIDRPMVLVNTSSLRQADDVLGRIALRALANEDVHVVATFPAGIPADLPRPTNATVCRFVPHAAILEKASCAITHGGMGTTLKRRDGHDTEGPRSRRTGLRRALRARPGRGRAASGGCPVRYPPSRQKAHREAAAGRGRRGNDDDRRRAPGGRRIRRNGRCCPRCRPDRAEATGPRS